MKRTLQIVFFALVLAAVVQTAWQQPRLPEKVAIHFNASGRVDGWAPRRFLTFLHLGTVAFLTAVVQGIDLVNSRLPKEYINFPHRDYWFAPERAPATRAWLVASGRLIGCALMLFFLALFHLVYRANLDPAPRLAGAAGWLLGGLLAVIAGVLVSLFVNFGRKPAD